MWGAGQRASRGAVQTSGDRGGICQLDTTDRVRGQEKRTQASQGTLTHPHPAAHLFRL